METLEIGEIVVGEKIRSVRKKLNLSQTEFGKRVKIGQDAISDYEKGRNEPNQRTIDAIIKEFSINKVWFDTGEGEMFEEVQPSTPKEGALIDTEKAKLYLAQLPEKEAELYIPYYDIEITAGLVELFLDDVEEVPAGYIYAPQYRNCVACNVKGDSMYDRIFPGSRLYVYYLKNKKYIDFGQIYLIVLDGYRLLKYIFPHPTDSTQVLLRSHNAHLYPDWPVERADILHLFKVKGYENQNAM